MSQDEKNTGNTLKIASFIIAVLISIIGYLGVKTLTSIDENIAEMKRDMKAQSQTIGDHSYILKDHGNQLQNHDNRIQTLEQKGEAK